VEPEALFRWSLATYLQRWFEVLASESGVAADDVLMRESVDALVLSADLSDSDASTLAAHARRINPNVTIICTFSGPEIREGMGREGRALCLEKPFDLSILARYLGVNTGASCPSRTRDKAARRGTGNGAEK
jgi:DNA-binding response OmpR family regulator